MNALYSCSIEEREEQCLRGAALYTFALVCVEIPRHIYRGRGHVFTLTIFTVWHIKLFYPTSANYNRILVKPEMINSDICFQIEQDCSLATLTCR